MRVVALTLFAFVTAASALADALAPVRAIRATDIIMPDDLVAHPGNHPGAVTDRAHAIGREARVTLYPGRPIMRADLVAAALIERNAVVRLRYAAGPLTIVTEGRSLARGREGDRLPVLNLDSRTTIYGTVAPDGAIEVE